ncbi:MAG: hypothetical protein V3V20_12310 [Algisphaera sp.]
MKSEKKSWRWWWLTFGAIGLLVGLSIAMAVPVKHTTQAMDEVSGARRVMASSWWGKTYEETFVSTALWRWIKQREEDGGEKAAPRWVVFGGNSYNVFGGHVRFSSGQAPAIYSLAMLAPEGFEGPLGVFVNKATEAQIEHFVTVMQKGTPQEQEAVVNSIMDFFLDGTMTPQEQQP